MLVLLADNVVPISSLKNQLNANFVTKIQTSLFLKAKIAFVTHAFKYVEVAYKYVQAGEISLTNKTRSILPLLKLVVYSLRDKHTKWICHQFLLVVAWVMPSNTCYMLIFYDFCFLNCTLIS